MLELIFSAIILGLMLSLVFIGPIFFLLIETSFARGARHALALDLGVISADLVCIIAAYFASGNLVRLIDEHPEFYRITALIIFFYGLYMIISKAKMHLDSEKKIINQNYLKTFISGFLLNFINIGVVLFWLLTVISVRNQYPDTQNFILYIGVMIGTYLFIDLIKIFLAKQFHDKLTPKITNNIRNAVGVILIIISVFIFMQSFSKFNQFDQKLEAAENQEQKL